MMVSEWVGNGNIKEFVRTHPNVDPLELVCFLFNVFFFACR